MKIENHYDVLGVTRSADGEVIRAAYRVLAKRYHPDTTTGAKDIAAARFRRVQEAYEVLSDVQRRAAYDDLRALPPEHGPPPDTEAQEDWFSWYRSDHSHLRAWNDGRSPSRMRPDHTPPHQTPQPDFYDTLDIGFCLKVWACMAAFGVAVILLNYLTEPTREHYQVIKPGSTICFDRYGNEKYC
jgi:curved DNA-binding protein CbpA